MKNANWYFDFLSPFTYLQNCRIDEFSPDLNIQRKPVLFAGLLKHWGTKGPAELPAKRLFTYQHVHWLADQLEAPLRFPEKPPFNPIALLRLCIAGGCTKNAVDAIFKCVWVEGLSGDNPDNWARFCDAVNIPESEATEKISNPEIKQELQLNGEEAIEKGIFGVPTLLVDGHLFWGYDSTDMALDYLDDPQLFESSDMKRVQSLPTGYGI